MAGCAFAGILMFGTLALTHAPMAEIGLPIVCGLVSGYGVLQYACTRNAYPEAMTGRRYRPSAAGGVPSSRATSFARRP
jgi:hypothetical protein